MKKNSDLDDTKPIEIISDDILENAEKSEIMSRVEKYKNREEEVAEVTDTQEVKELVEISEEEKNALESAEEALAEKNINEAEKILEEEKAKKDEEAKKEEDSLEEDKPTIIDKLMQMPKKQKIILIIIAVAVIVLLTAILVLVFGKQDKKVEPKKKKEEEKITIVDNYYYKNGKLHILSGKDDELGTYECKNKDEEKCYVAINTYRDTLDVPRVLDDNGNEKKERMPIYNNDYVFIYDNENATGGNIALYSLKEGKEKAAYLDTKAYDGDFLILKDESSKYGLFQFKETLNIVISPVYNKLYMIDGTDKLVGENGKGYVIINKVGKNLSDVLITNGEIKYYNENYLVVKENDKYSVIDIRNNNILKDYQFITVDEKYIFAVDSKNNLYVRDNEGTKYNEVPVILKNNDYVPGYMYDENGKLKKTMLSFKPTVQKNSIEIMPYTKKYEEDKNVSISILEGVLSKSFKYYSYFNGILYFYGDETKATPIGSYKCSVVNNVNANNMALNNCIMASDTVFEDNDMMSMGEENRHSTIPIYNNRFVFVQDGAKNIVLYDLIENKVKSSYTQVNTYTANNDNNLTLVNGDYDVVGVNKKGMYGIIRIGNDSVQSVYPFDYKHIEKVGGRFIAKNQSDKWVILGGNGTEYKNKIRGYSKDLDLVKVKGTNYEVIDSNGNVIDSNLKYVQIYDAFYAGVDKNNKVMLYTYEGYVLLKDSIPLSSTTYCRTDKPSFKVSSSSDGTTRTFVISVFDGSEYKDVVVKEKGEDAPVPEENNPSSDDNDNQNKEKPQKPDDNKDDDKNKPGV